MLFALDFLFWVVCVYVAACLHVYVFCLLYFRLSMIVCKVCLCVCVFQRIVICSNMFTCVSDCFHVFCFRCFGLVFFVFVSCCSLLFGVDNVCLVLFVCFVRCFSIVLVLFVLFDCKCWCLFVSVCFCGVCVFTAGCCCGCVFTAVCCRVCLLGFVCVMYFNVFKSV